MNRTAGALAVIIGLSGITAQTRAEDSEVGDELSAAEIAEGSAASKPGKFRLYGGARLGFGGEVETDPEGGMKSDDDLLTTFGGQIGADYVVMDYVALGAELRVAGLNSDGRDDADIGRDLFVDVLIKPRVRYPVLDTFEVYGTLPLGVTFISVNGDLEDKLEAGVGGASVDVSAGPGFTLGVGAGATYFMTQHVGINAEMAYLLYWYSTEAKVSFAGGSMKSESDISLGQFSLLANLVFAL